MVQDSIEKLKRLFKVYPTIYKGKQFLISEFKEIYPKVSESDIAVYCMKSDVMHYVFTSIIIKIDKFVFTKLYSTQNILDIYLGFNDDCDSISNISSDLVVLYEGAGMPNKQKGNLIVQVMEGQRLRNKKCILCFMGTKSQLTSQLPEVISECSNFKYPIIELGSDKNSQVEEDII